MSLAQNLGGRVENLRSLPVFSIQVWLALEMGRYRRRPEIATTEDVSQSKTRGPLKDAPKSKLLVAIANPRTLLARAILDPAQDGLPLALHLVAPSKQHCPIAPPAIEKHETPYARSDDLDPSVADEQPRDGRGIAGRFVVEEDLEASVLFLWFHRPHSILPAAGVRLGLHSKVGGVVRGGVQAEQ